MDLFLLRHGKAENFNPAGDAARVLVEKGHHQADRAGRVLKRAGWLPDIVLVSPLVRARQTANAFCEAAGIPGAILQGWLACGMSPERALSELTAFAEFKRVALIGHEPDLSRLIGHLLGASAGWVRMKKGSLACLQVNPPTPIGALEFLIPPRLTADIWNGDDSPD
jgi:phosphohistidine phosphatase